MYVAEMHPREERCIMDTAVFRHLLRGTCPQPRGRVRYHRLRGCHVLPVELTLGPQLVGDSSKPNNPYAVSRLHTKGMSPSIWREMLQNCRMETHTGDPKVVVIAMHVLGKV